MEQVLVSSLPVGAKFVDDGQTLIVVRKSGWAVEAEFEGINDPHKVYFGFEPVYVAE